MALAEAQHHSCGVEPSGPNVAPRGQKTASTAGTRPKPLEEVSAPQDTWLPRGLSSTPLLADTAAEAVDARTVKFLFQKTGGGGGEEERGGEAA